MEIEIRHIQGELVLVDTAIGCFSGIWCSQPPIVAKRYIVELDNDDVLTPNAIELCNSCNPCIENVDNGIKITGFVEEIQDNVIVLRLQKHLMMLEISSDSDFFRYVGCCVRIKLNEIRIYDTGIV